MLLKIYACLILVTLLSLGLCSNCFTSSFGRAKVPAGGPTVSDVGLKADLIIGGLKGPTSMVFLGPDDILVTEKNSGMVQRVVKGTISTEPLLEIKVSKTDERGLLGIALSTNKENVFLYYTREQDGDGNGTVNSIYRYELVNGKLTAPRQILDLPGLPGPQHNGGKLAIGPDNNLYIAIGDVGSSFVGTNSETKAQNYFNGSEPDGRAGIIRITQDGKPNGTGLIGNSPILNMYYAYGIKNIFGFDFDPISGIMWDTENGPRFGDEINAVLPGFNSGWAIVQGVWYLQPPEGQNMEPGKGEKAPEMPQGLVDFGGKGTYSSPEFTWDDSVAPTALRFLNSSKLRSTI